MMPSNPRAMASAIPGSSLADRELVPDETTLEDLLSQPTAAVIETLARYPGDVLLLGAGGKMGASLARMIRRASQAAGQLRDIFGASRFSNPALAPYLQASGITPISCDLLNEESCRALPDASIVVFMTGMKFGGTGNEGRMWAMNTLVPARLNQQYRNSRWLVFSTGNVYALSSPDSGGPTESTPPVPAGEYGMSALGRERVCQYSSQSYGTPMAIVRLNYACDLRYGVLVDLAQLIWNNQPVDLTMGHLNTVWQGDANAHALLALAHANSPPFVINVTGPEILSVRNLCEFLARHMNKTVQFTGQEAPTALLNNAHKAISLFGLPQVPTETLLRWVAYWVMNDQPTLGKPTHFQNRSGQF